MQKYLFAYLLILLAVVTRFLPHPANFTAVGAIALFSGIYLPKRWALIAPLTAMFVSDIFIGFYSAPIMLSVYIGFIIMGAIGLLIRNHKKISTVLGGTILGSILFYLITNWAVWAFGTMYPHTVSGLFTSYYTALPFFRNSLTGDLFFTGSLVVLTETASALATKFTPTKTTNTI